MATLSFPTVALSRLALCEGNSKKPVYTMHKWWARRLGVVFRMLLVRHAAGATADHNELWRRFYARQALPSSFRVLDPFLGGGTTLVEAAKQGASCVGVDIDPVACFITELELQPPDPEAVRARYVEIQAEISAELLKFYRSRVDGQEVDVVYFFWVDRVTCSGCGTEGDAHPTYQVAHDVPTKRQTVVCRGCGELTDIPLSHKSFTCMHCETRTVFDQAPVTYGRYQCPSCQLRRPMHELWTSNSVKPRMFAKEYVDSMGERRFASASRLDVSRYRAAQKELAKEWASLPIPDVKIPSRGRNDRRPLLYGYTRYRELFNERQLLCLGRIAAAIRTTSDKSVRRALALAFSHSLATNNMFCSYAFGYRRLCPIFSVHAYRKVTRPVEGNVWGLSTGRGSFRNAVRAVVAGSEYMGNPYEYRYSKGKKINKRERPDRVPIAPVLPDGASKSTVQILNRSFEDLSPVQSGSIDLILTDPPYYDNISYSELSDFYHVWLRRLLGQAYIGANQAHTPLAHAIYGGQRKGATVDPIAQYTARLSGVFAECRRVAKQDAALIFTFHHRSAEAWNSLGRALLGAGFRIHEVYPVRSEGQSGLHSYEGTIKWDSVFVCYQASDAHLSSPTDRTIAETVRSARLQTGAWGTHIRRSGLDFSEADAESFSMASILSQFSERRLDPRYLEKALAGFGRLDS